MTEEQEKYIAALLRERDAAPRLGSPERVAEIDAELERAGYTDPEKDSAPKGRTSPAARARTTAR